MDPAYKMKFFFKIFEHDGSSHVKENKKKLKKNTDKMDSMLPPLDILLIH